MKPRLFAIYLFIVLAPLGLLAWLGGGLARDEQARVESRFRELMANQLAVRKEAVSTVMAATERGLMELTELPESSIQLDLNRPESPSQAERPAVGKKSVKMEVENSPENSPVNPAFFRDRVRTARLARQIFVLKSDGGFVFPLLDGAATEDEKRFFERTRSVWESGIRFGVDEDNLPPGPSDARNAGSGNTQSRSSSGSWGAAKPVSLSNAAPFERDHGWHTWFWGNGVQLVFWRRADSGHVVGVEVDRMALLSDIVSALPDTKFDPSASLNGRIVLSDAQNRVIYQWGAYEPTEGIAPDVRLPVDAPLSMWTLNYYSQPDTLSVGGAWFNVGTALALSCVVVAGLAVYFFRENSREIREASQRVSFVNQVSHELKTPLTNIRMYAELLEVRMEDADETSRENLAVIVEESQRLSRMIGNVLAFAKRQRGGLKPNPRRCAPDDIVRSVIERFRPALTAKGVEISFAGNAPGEISLDSDFLEQILGNLFGNVEKYAAVGGVMDVRSGMNDDVLTLRIADRGPGIPKAQREAVFLPFQRLSDRLTDGVAGTGIGLTIAREQARNHGGDLTIVESEEGATFQLTLRVGGKGDTA